MRWLPAVVAVAVLGWCAGCEEGLVPEDAVRSSFTATYACPAELTTLSAEDDNGLYQASGCGHTQHYACGKQRCTAEGEAGGSAKSHEITATVALSRAWLGLKASPAKSETLSLTLGTTDDNVSYKCQLDAMIDGQRVELPRDPANKLSLQLSREMVEDFAAARQMAFRACDVRWSLDTKQLTEFRKFALRYVEELAWNGDARQGSIGGHLAPAGGWPAWKSLGALPPGGAGAALPPTQLFEQLAPSVVRVESTLSAGMAQGSAVAISPSTALTNCHVVAGALKVVVKQPQNEWPAHVVRSDPKADRCVLEVAGATLKPIAGVRAYGDLKIGEAVYTLGNPSGLDLSISDGLLSGLRTEEGVQYVQTTAPISPGSSGGGLFDSRGNLVGITTLSLIGRRNVNQSLNFAIAADLFWKP